MVSRKSPFLLYIQPWLVKGTIIPNPPCPVDNDKVIWISYILLYEWIVQKIVAQYILDKWKYLELGVFLKCIFLIYDHPWCYNKIFKAYSLRTHNSW